MGNSEGTAVGVLVVGDAVGAIVGSYVSPINNHSATFNDVDRVSVMPTLLATIRYVL